MVRAEYSSLRLEEKQRPERVLWTTVKVLFRTGVTGNFHV